jgi:hypothetical protein
MNKCNDLFEKAMDEMREKFYREDNAIAIPRDEMHLAYYRLVVEECARAVEHIKVWDSNLGDHIKRHMGLL